MAVKAPAVITPWGQGSPVGSFVFEFPPESDIPATYRVQISEQRDMGTLHWQTVASGGFAGRRVTLAYPGAAPPLVQGRLYYWRARGESPAGPYSIVRAFSPDPTAGTGPYDTWARALLSLAGYPRPTAVLGTLLPTGPEIAQLLALPWGARVTLRTPHPSGAGTADQLTEVLGFTVHVDALTGWEVAAVTRDVT